MIRNANFISTILSLTPQLPYSMSLLPKPEFSSVPPCLCVFPLPDCQIAIRESSDNAKNPLCKRFSISLYAIGNSR